jgi:hypothetical protein
MSFDDEFASAEKQQVEQRSKYMSSPRVASVEVMKCVLSENVDKDYKGCPYMEVEFKDTATEELNTSKFFRTRDTDSEETRGYKLKGIKEFFLNAGVDMKAKGSKALVEVVGKQMKVLFRAEEYIGYDKNQNNMPVVKEAIRYLYSGPIGEELTGKNEYFRKILKADDKSKFDAELKTWERDNKASNDQAKAEAKANTPNAEPLGDEEDDLPF